MEADERSSANRRVVKRLGMAAIAMFGFGFALVPLYDVFCEITGINGKTGRLAAEAALSQQVDADRQVTVEFLAVVNGDLPWEFKPMVRRVKVHPGEVTEVNYFARNRTTDPVAGQAVPSVAPGLATRPMSASVSPRSRAAFTSSEYFINRAILCVSLSPQSEQEYTVAR